MEKKNDTKNNISKKNYEFEQNYENIINNLARYF
jgi:hypothetical protein